MAQLDAYPTITLQPPWADFIAIGASAILDCFVAPPTSGEWVAIHAGSREPSRRYLEALLKNLPTDVDAEIARPYLERLLTSRICVLNAVVAIGRVGRVYARYAGHVRCVALTDIARIMPIPACGERGFWTWRPGRTLEILPDFAEPVVDLRSGLFSGAG